MLYSFILHLRGEILPEQRAVACFVFVTRQAVSRWETGETAPNTETLKLISKTFDISINTLLGAPRQLICQCCGMPLTDDCISREPDDSFNEEYCKWCYTDGKFIYHSLDELVDFLVDHVRHGIASREEARAVFARELTALNYWKDQNAAGIQPSDPE